MCKRLLEERYGLHPLELRRAGAGAGSDVWFADCAEGGFVVKLPEESEMSRPENEPQLCEFLLARGIPACRFVKNAEGGFITRDSCGRAFTVQRRIAGTTPAWNTADGALMRDSAELLGRVHSVLAEYPRLPEGIGAGFFAYMTPERAAQSLERSLFTARQAGAAEAPEIAWRLELARKMPPPDFDMARLTCCNTHGDYCVNQFICENGRLKAVIDWTAACVHPAVWEIMRSFAYSAPCCAQGVIDRGELSRYVEYYARFSPLSEYDLAQLERVFLWQIAVCDYYGQYYASPAANKELFLRQARHATLLLKNNAQRCGLA